MTEDRNTSLTLEQRKLLCNVDRVGIISEKDHDICPGIHFCPDWDYLAICENSPEAEACRCPK